MKRGLRIAALGLLPLAAGCWVDRPNLRSTGGGYTAAAEVNRTAGRKNAGQASEEARGGRARASSPAADTAPAGH